MTTEIIKEQTFINNTSEVSTEQVLMWAKKEERSDGLVCIHANFDVRKSKREQ